MNAIIILPQCGNQRLIHRGCHRYYRVQHRVTKTTAGVKVRSWNHACFNLLLSIVFFPFCWIDLITVVTLILYRCSRYDAIDKLGFFLVLTIYYFIDSFFLMFSSSFFFLSLLSEDMHEIFISFKLIHNEFIVIITIFD